MLSTAMRRAGVSLFGHRRAPKGADMAHLSGEHLVHHAKTVSTSSQHPAPIPTDVRSRSIGHRKRLRLPELPFPHPHPHPDMLSHPPPFLQSMRLNHRHSSGERDDSGARKARFKQAEEELQFGARRVGSVRAAEGRA